MTPKEAAEALTVATEQFEDVLVDYYAEGASLSELAEETGRSLQGIRNILSARGVQIRSRGGANRA